jgi:hypothetical protein
VPLLLQRRQRRAGAALQHEPSHKFEKLEVDEKERWSPIIGVFFLFHDQLPFKAPSIETAQKMQQSDSNCARHPELCAAFHILRQTETQHTILLGTL